MIISENVYETNQERIDALRKETLENQGLTVVFVGEAGPIRSLSGGYLGLRGGEPVNLTKEETKCISTE